MNNLLSTEAYAELCKVSTTTIRNRIANKKIIATETPNGYYIDVVKYPPIGAGKPGRNKAAKVLEA